MNQVKKSKFNQLSFYLILIPLPFYIGIAFSLFFALLYFNNSFFPVQRVDPWETTKISITGDLMAHYSQVLSAKKKDNSYDFSSMYHPIKSHLSQSDYTIGNFETTISDPAHRYAGFPLFRTPESYVKALKECGFDLLTTSNNHSFDGSLFGVNKTIDTIAKYQIDQTGTWKDKESSQKILIKEINGIKIAILAYTHSTNGNEWKIPSSEREWRIHRIHEKIRIQQQFVQAKKQGADLILASVHWGNEYQRAPDFYQKKWAKMLGELGADIIAGSHPHVLQPVEWIEVDYNGEKKKVLTAWSLGNFISHMGHHIQKHSDTGMIWNIYLERRRYSGEIKIKSTDYQPIWVKIDRKKRPFTFEVLPLYEKADFLPSDYKMKNKKAIKRYEEAWSETVKLMNTDWFKPNQISQISE